MFSNPVFSSLWSGSRFHFAGHSEKWANAKTKSELASTLNWIRQSKNDMVSSLEVVAPAPAIQELLIEVNPN